jgi:3-deoxy-7-phosphoheptulonate synthase
MVVVGPCSIHDTAAAEEYARRLAALRDELGDRLFIVMRVYFEKPRTTVGWKGLINDPHLDGTCDIDAGLRAAREVLSTINELGLPCATELLDPIVPQYISDFVTWAAIGARTTESQTHREMASGLSMPVGFKNATDGDLQIALDGITASRQPHAFLGITASGTTCVVRTRGNPDVHLVMRGGSKPNYQKPHIAFAKAALEGIAGRRLILVDCSHGNSNKDYRRQPEVFEHLVDLYAGGEEALLGCMLESNLVEGNQPIGPDLVYGRSITDGCIGWETTELILRRAHERLTVG